MSGGDIKHARIDCAAGVAYGSDIDEVRRILLDIASQLDHLVEETEETNKIQRSRQMIDKFLYKFFGLVDSWFYWVEKQFIQQKKKRKKR